MKQNGTKPKEQPASLHDELMTYKQLAAFLKRSENTLRQDVLNRRIPFIKLNGGAVRFRMSDIQRWLDKNAVGVKS